MSAAPDPCSAPLPWWRHAMVWLVISGPLAVVLAGIVTALLTLAHPDPEIASTNDRAAEASLRPALQARNHAAAPPR